MSVPAPRLPSHANGRWETIRYALDSNARTFRLCLILLMTAISPVAAGVVAVLIHHALLCDQPARQAEAPFWRPRRRPVPGLGADVQRRDSVALCACPAGRQQERSVRLRLCTKAQPNDWGRRPGAGARSSAWPDVGLPVRQPYWKDHRWPIRTEP
jgi:hypothetical protein